ncbi:hypothetical protein HD597_009606 [Nonomuraea thailandensis]|uniref:Uncharacterized protein n=1 Tax=Nonomuraea thailandensis TaxID=1188745 RepID=A0A9X2GP67_9ACTN|nr:hypothetical protein [Nonomuraea thailandensis]MCP2362586.1 hypothetical protein [Nonomuraea thailandensis]
MTCDWANLPEHQETRHPNRNLAVRALSAWDHATLPPVARTAVAAALRAEPDPAVRERFERLHEAIAPR